MNVKHRKIDSDRFTLVRRDGLEPLSATAWASDGSDVQIDFEMDGRKYYIHLDRAEGEALCKQLLNWFLSTAAGE
jgi:hypothetical protein